MTKTTLKTYFNTGDIPTEAQFSEFIDGIGGGPIIVSASNAPNSWKSCADYLCDGVADDVEIQAAIGSLPTAGGTVLLSPGIFNSSSVIVLRGHLFFRGSGAPATTINALGCNGITYSGTFGTDASRYVTLQDFRIKGDYTASKTGISLYSLLNFQIQRCWIDQFSLAGLETLWTIFGSVDDCYIRNNDGDGMKLNEVSNAISYKSTQFTGNNGWGVKILGKDINFVTDLSFLSCGIEGNCLGGMMIDYLGKFSLISTHFEDNAHVNLTPAGRTPGTQPVIGTHLQIGANSSAATPVRSVSVMGCGFTDVTGSSGSGYDVDLSHVNGIWMESNNHHRNATAALRYDPTKSFNFYYGECNNFGFTPVYRLKNKGAAAVADGGTIAHGLNATPTYANLTASIAGEIPTLTSKDTTNLTIAIKKHDGTPGTTQTIYWRAEV